MDKKTISGVQIKLISRNKLIEVIYESQARSN